MTRSLWIVPEKSGGIRTYAEGLLPAMGEDCRVLWHLPKHTELDEEPAPIVHLQHEFGLFGSKRPGFYEFPKWIREAKRTHIPRRWIATAHTVLSRDWEYGSVTGWKAIPATLLNRFVVPWARKAWLEGTWGEFDGVIVHSKHQAATIKSTGCPHVAVIPHYIPIFSQSEFKESPEPQALVFGYFSPDKGQDIAIRAWAALGSTAPKLVLAGGLRREADRGYLEHCKDLILKYKLAGKIEITGFVPKEKVSDFYRRSTLVIAPFRETNGSGSLATALGHGAAILASDLLLNREITERTPKSLAFFKPEDSESLALEVKSLLSDTGLREKLRAGAREYAAAHSPERTAVLHREFYQRVSEDQRR